MKRGSLPLRDRQGLEQMVVDHVLSVCVCVCPKLAGWLLFFALGVCSLYVCMSTFGSRFGARAQNGLLALIFGWALIAVPWPLQ